MGLFLEPLVFDTGVEDAAFASFEMSRFGVFLFFHPVCSFDDIPNASSIISSIVKREKTPPVTTVEMKQLFEPTLHVLGSTGAIMWNGVRVTIQPQHVAESTMCCYAVCATSESRSVCQSLHSPGCLDENIILTSSLRHVSAHDVGMKTPWFFSNPKGCESFTTLFFLSSSCVCL